VWRDYVRLSLRSIGHRKKRSWLTIIGIVIGVMAVVALISLGQALQSAVDRQFDQFGVNILSITPATTQGFGRGFAGTPFSLDLDTVRGVKGVEAVGTILFKDAYVNAEEIEGFLRVYGMSEAMPHIFSGFDIERGRNFLPGDTLAVILGHRVIDDLGVGVGDEFTIEDRQFQVIGVLQDSSNPQNNDGLFVPLTTLQAMFNEGEKVSFAMARTGESADVETVADTLRNTLKKTRGRDDLRVRTAEQFREIVQNALIAVQGFLGGIAAISLLVGGIGVMNTMYTAVLERTREIGVMKAVGAKRRQITTLFLIESGFMGLVGGVIGIVLGLLVSNSLILVAKHFIEQLSLLAPSFSPGLIVSALAFSYLVGMMSGFFPARSAAKLRPVEALRHD